MRNKRIKAVSMWMAWLVWMGMGLAVAFLYDMRAAVLFNSGSGVFAIFAILYEERTRERRIKK